MTALSNLNLLTLPFCHQIFSDEVDAPDRHKDEDGHEVCNSIAAGKAVATLDEWNTVHSLRSG